MNVRAISSCALLVLGFLSCACGASSGVTNTPASTRGSRCLPLDSACAIANDCCSQVCRNGDCVEQNGS
jgi:hypothetical protein